MPLMASITTSLASITAESEQDVPSASDVAHTRRHCGGMEMGRQEGEGEEGSRR